MGTEGFPWNQGSLSVLEQGKQGALDLALPKNASLKRDRLVEKQVSFLVLWGSGLSLGTRLLMRPPSRTESQVPTAVPATSLTVLLYDGKIQKYYLRPLRTHVYCPLYGPEVGIL